MSRSGLAAVGALMYVRPGKRSRFREGRPKALRKSFPSMVSVKEDTRFLQFHVRKSKFFPQGRIVFLLVTTVFKNQLTERASCFGANWLSSPPLRVSVAERIVGEGDLKIGPSPAFEQ